MVGGNAVAAWVARVDVAAVRNTQDVDILIRREDFERAKTALVAAGFIHAQILGIEAFLDGQDAHPRHSVHLVFANEKVHKDYEIPSPDVDESVRDVHFRIAALEALVRMKLNSFRTKDRMHLLDMIEIGLIDDTWPPRFPPALAERLQGLLDNPES